MERYFKKKKRGGGVGGIIIPVIILARRPLLSAVLCTITVYIYTPISTHLRVLTGNTVDSERNLNVEFSGYQPQVITGHVISER